MRTPADVYGEYLVVGRRKYRDHATGTVFQAKLDRLAEQRAIARGDIVLVRHINPGLQPGSYTLPDGWHPPPPPDVPPVVNEAPEGASHIQGG